MAKSTNCRWRNKYSGEFQRGRGSATRACFGPNKQGARAARGTVAASQLPKGPYEVRLSGAANPDIAGGFWGGGSAPKLQWKTVRSIPEASEAARFYILVNELGGGNWTGGTIRVKKTGKTVGRVSYNGRVWTPGPWKSAKEIVFKRGGSARCPTGRRNSGALRWKKSVTRKGSYYAAGPGDVSYTLSRDTRPRRGWTAFAYPGATCCPSGTYLGPRGGESGMRVTYFATEAEAKSAAQAHKNRHG